MIDEAYPCIALGYTWELATAGAVGHDVLLAVAVVCTEVRGEPPEAVKERWKEAESCADAMGFCMRFPSTPTDRDEADVSGIIGLLGVMRGTDGERQAAAFERLVADATLWGLIRGMSMCTPGRLPVVLLQGPMLPKLRGRLYYRGISPELPVLCITYQPDWLCRAAERPRLWRSSPQLAGADLEWEGPLPPLAIDRGGRSFVASMDGRLRYHVEVPANNWDPADGAGWWQRRLELCRFICGEGMGTPSDLADRYSLELEETEPPWPLALARVAAEARMREDARREQAIAAFTAWSLSQLQQGPAPRSASSGTMVAYQEAYNEVWGLEAEAKIAALPSPSHRPPTGDAMRIREACLKALAQRAEGSRLWSLIA